MTINMKRVSRMPWLWVHNMRFPIPVSISLDVPNNPVVFAFNVGDWYDIVVYKYNVGTTHHLMTFFQLAPLVQNMQPLVQGQ